MNNKKEKKIREIPSSLMASERRTLALKLMSDQEDFRSKKIGWRDLATLTDSAGKLIRLYQADIMAYVVMNRSGQSLGRMLEE
jgi:hypothetical protein